MIQEFLKYQAENKGLAAQTIDGYRKELRAFVSWAQPKGLRWSTISSTDMQDYVRHENARGMKPRTIKRRVEVIRLILEYAKHQGYIKENVAWFTQTPKIADELPKAASCEEIEAYLKMQASSTDFLKCQIIVGLIYETGLRLGEVLSLRGEDFDLSNGRIKVQGKGRKERYVYYGNFTKTWAVAMAKRQGIIFDLGDVETRYMMYNYAGSYVKGIHPHAIRHAFACKQLNSGMGLKTLSTLMGHKHVETTEIYAQLADKRVGEEYRRINN